MTPTAVATSSTGSETLLGPSPAPRVRRESTGLSGSKPTNAEVRVCGGGHQCSLSVTMSTSQSRCPRL